MSIKKDSVMAAINISDIKYEFGTRSSIFKKLSEEGAKRTVFVTRLYGKIADDLSLELCFLIKEIISSCKRFGIHPVFAFKVSSNIHDMDLPKIIIPKSIEALLKLLDTAKKSYFGYCELSDLNGIFKNNRNDYLIGENICHYKFSPLLYRPFSIFSIMAKSCYTERQINCDFRLFDEISVKKYDFFFAEEILSMNYTEKMGMKYKFYQKCKSCGLPLTILNYCFEVDETKSETRYVSAFQLGYNDEYGTDEFRKFVLNESVDWLYSNVDFDYDMLYNEVNNF